MAFPGLRARVLPTIHDKEKLFLGPMDNPNLSRQDASALKRWVDQVYRDPQARQRPSEVDMKGQSTLLDWANNNAKFCSVPGNRGGDFESGYKMLFGKFKTQRSLNPDHPGAEKKGG